jgi:energy-coupling factor transporter ATP-binding protein EcfA2
MLEETNPLGTLRSLHAAGFTVFEDETFEFSDGLNVIIGENGTGKTHLLKLAYAATKALYPEKAGRPLVDEELPVTVSRKLDNVFLPDQLGRLCRRTGPGRSSAQVELEFGKPNGDSEKSVFSLSSEKKLVAVTGRPKQLPNSPEGGPIYLPPREVISLVPEFVEDYRKTKIRFEETYFDLALNLLGSPTRGPRPGASGRLMTLLETAMGGKLVQKKGRLYLKSKNGFEVEAPLMAEGVRKLATLAYLALNGSLARYGALFWDEPEANLNPRLMGALADALVQLVADGVQVFVATHSLFFLREIALRVDKKDPLPARYFSLIRDKDRLHVNRAEKIDELDGVAVLDAAIEQDERLERLYWERRK